MAGAGGMAGVGGTGGSAGTWGPYGPPPVSGFAGFGGSLPPLGPGAAGAPVTCQDPIAISAGTAATVTANLDMVGRVVSPDLLGIHTSVYDGNMLTPTTPDLLKAAGVKIDALPGRLVRRPLSLGDAHGDVDARRGRRRQRPLHRARRRLRPPSSASSKKSAPAR